MRLCLRATRLCSCRFCGTAVRIGDALAFSGHGLAHAECALAHWMETRPREADALTPDAVGAEHAWNVVLGRSEPTTPEQAGYKNADDHR